MSIALWLAASTEGLELNQLDQVGHQALAQGGKGAAAWLENLTNSALASAEDSIQGRSLAELAMAATYALPSQLEVHMPKLVPALVTKVGIGTASAQSSVCSGAVAVLSALFDRWDELNEGRGVLLHGLSGLIPALCAVARAGDTNSEAALELLTTIVQVAGGSVLRSAVWSLEAAAGDAFDAASTSHPNTKRQAAKLLGLLPATLPAPKSASTHAFGGEDGKGGSGGGPAGSSSSGLEGWTLGCGRLILAAANTLRQVWPAVDREHRAVVATLNLPPAGSPPARPHVLKPFNLASASPPVDHTSSNKKSSTGATASSTAAAPTVVLIGSSQAYALFASERFELLCASLATALHAPPPAPTQSSGAVPVGAILLLLEMVASVSPGNRNDNSGKGSSSGSGSLASTLVGDADGAIPAVAMRALLPNIRHASLRLAQSLLTIPGLTPGPLMSRARRLSAVLRRLVEPSLPPPMPTSSPQQSLTQPSDLAPFLRGVITTTTMSGNSNSDTSNDRGLPLACAVLCQLSGSFGSGAALELVAMSSLNSLVHGVAYALTVSADPAHRFRDANGGAPAHGSGGEKGMGKYSKRARREGNNNNGSSSSSSAADGSSSSSNEVVGKSAGDISLAALCGVHCCSALEALVLTCGPLLPLSERNLVEQIVAVGLAQLSTSANRTLRRPVSSSVSTDGAGSSSVEFDLAGSSSSLGGSANKLSAALCGGVGSQGEAFRSSLITLASALVQAPRGDGSGSGLAPLLSDACHSLSSGGAWTASCNNGGLTSATAAAVPMGLARARAMSVLEMVHHPRALPLAAPHFWPTTSGSLARGLTTAACTRTLPLRPSPHAEGPAGTAATMMDEGDAYAPAGLAQVSVSGRDNEEDDESNELEAHSEALETKRQRTNEPTASPAPALNRQGTTVPAAATTTTATEATAASAPLKTAAAAPPKLSPPAGVLPSTQAPLAAKVAPEVGQRKVESDDDELPDIVDSGPDDSDMEA